MQESVTLSKEDAVIWKKLGDIIRPNFNASRETFLSKMTKEDWASYDERSMDLTVSQE